MLKPYKVALYCIGKETKPSRCEVKEARTHRNRYALSLPYLPVSLGLGVMEHTQDCSNAWATK